MSINSFPMVNFGLTEQDLLAIKTRSKVHLNEAFECQLVGRNDKRVLLPGDYTVTAKTKEGIAITVYEPRVNIHAEPSGMNAELFEKSTWIRSTDKK